MVKTVTHYDVVIIGGGATGLGCAVESASRGYKTLLLEAYDYGKGASSKSTKLVHGGIRYLANLDFALVKEGLEERHYFLKNAPHLARAQTYLIPFHNLFEKIQYHLGVYLYDFLAGKFKLGHSSFLSKKTTLSAVPSLNPHHIVGSGIYYDGQFDDTRMLITLLRTFESFGGVAYNYHPVDGIIEENGTVVGVQVKGKQFFAKVIINATGTYADTLMNLAEPTVSHHFVEPAQGTHLTFDKNIFECEHALVIPKTVDGRILFVLPWHDKIIVGTTDVEMDHPSLDPLPQNEEIELILSTFNQYTKKTVTRSDIRSVFVGQRPLAKPALAKDSKKISRKHEIFCTKNNFITIVGGKWTIYRRMGEDTINFAVQKNLLPQSASVTKNLLLFAATENALPYPLNVYGAEATQIQNIQKARGNQNRLHPDLPYFEAEVIYHLRHEHAKTIEDILARRTRALFLDAKAAIDAAPRVVELMAEEWGKDAPWMKNELEIFNAVARKYLV